MFSLGFDHSFSSIKSLDAVGEYEGGSTDEHETRSRGAGHTWIKRITKAVTGVREETEKGKAEDRHAYYFAKTISPASCRVIQGVCKHFGESKYALSNWQTIRMYVRVCFLVSPIRN